MTEAAIIRGLDWLKANQDPEGSWGEKTRMRRATQRERIKTP